MNSTPNIMETQAQNEIQAVLDWAVPRIIGNLPIIESQRHGWLDDIIVSRLAGWLQTQADEHHPDVTRIPRVGCEINLGNGYIVGVERQRKGTYKRRNWAAYCRRVAGEYQPSPIEQQLREVQATLPGADPLNRKGNFNRNMNNYAWRVR